MSAFFVYGTLMHPDVLTSVTQTGGAHLSFQPAVAEGWKRSKVDGEDYPAMVAEEGSSVRGTLVHGLTTQDVKLLDEFEGPQYAVQPITLDAFGTPQALARGQDVDVLGKLPEGQAGQKVEARTYVWTAGADLLEKAPWDFAHFTKEKLHLWSMPSFSTPPPAFGRDLLKYWSFAPGYVNLNHGYGSTPLPVQKYTRELRVQSENNIDRFMRRDYLPLLAEVRESLAELTRAKTDDVVLVPNATHGVNTITSNIVWKDGDVIVAYSTTYGAILQTLRYTCDRSKDAGLNVELVVIPLEFPMAHVDVVQRTEDVLSAHNVRGGGDVTAGRRVRMVVIDGIASNPGMVMPWKALAQLCRTYGAFSLVDAAHVIGQLDLDLSDDFVCDALISNMHKWLFAERSAAMLWVPQRNQKLIRSSFPTSFDYESEKFPGTGKGPWSFVKQFDWTGTIDWVPFLSVTAALSFRRFLGGEARINEYCHSLAVAGGKRLQELFSAAAGQPVAIMENKKGELTANMVNAQLPFTSQPAAQDYKGVYRFIEDQQFASNCFSAVYFHNGLWWVRCSAQVWNELADFDYVAQVLIGACAKVTDGSWKAAA